MASGFQDWDVPVNINAQTLAEIINRPKYGTAQVLHYDGIVAPSTLQSLGTISGQGMVYGGNCYWESTGDAKDASISLLIDDVVFIGFSPNTLTNQGVSAENSYYFYVGKYDTYNNQYLVSFSRGITFETSFEAKIATDTAQNHTIIFDLIYGLV